MFSPSKKAGSFSSKKKCSSSFVNAIILFDSSMSGVRPASLQVLVQSCRLAGLTPGTGHRALSRICFNFQSPDV